MLQLLMLAKAELQAELPVRLLLLHRVALSSSA